MHAEGVSPIYLLSDMPELYRSGLAPGVVVKHRDEMDNVMVAIREEKGCSAIVYVQTCAAEKRRRRKRGQMEDPKKRVFINPAVCEGCGDCSTQSNCVSVEPFETAMGRKRRINQSSCNKDYSCAKGFCPSFVTVEGAELQKPSAAGAPPIEDVPEPKVVPLDGPLNIAVTGVGGTGVLTIGAILGMAAHLDGKASMVLDMAGLAQKGGAVLSHIRLGERTEEVAAPRIPLGQADVLLAADDVVASSAEGIGLCNIEKTTAVVNTAIMPVADFVLARDFDFKAHAVEGTIRRAVREESAFLNFGDLARRAAGDTIATNIMMVGYASQMGLLPIGREAIEAAIRLNGVAVEANINAYNWGRAFAAGKKLVSGETPEGAGEVALETMSLDDIIVHRVGHLTAYQGKRLAKRYQKKVAEVRASLGEDHARRVAISYAKLLSYKDEYEVARLLTEPEFRQTLEGRFDGPVKLKLNLAPPLLPGKDPQGRPKKRAFGAWMFGLMGGLKRLKSLRGTPFDPFGYTAERKAERKLIRDYEARIAMCEKTRTDANDEIIGALLDLPQSIRGFGPVKMAAIADARANEEALLQQLDRPPERMAAE